MAWSSVFLGLVLAVAILSLIPKVQDKTLRGLIGFAAFCFLAAGVVFSSVHFVPSSRVGVVTKNLLGPKMVPGQVIALEGEIGTQAQVLTPGWHFGYWPGLFAVSNVPLISIDDGEIGLVKAVDGLPLSTGEVFAKEMPTVEFKRLIDNPLEFLSKTGGQKGPQTNVLLPGNHRINTALFTVTLVRQLDVKAGTVAVLKSNVGSEPSIEFKPSEESDEIIYLAEYGEKGIRAAALSPGKYPINQQAFEVYTVSTETRIAAYTSKSRSGIETLGAITVKSNDGFTFPVDVRVAYYIQEDDAPKIVARLGGDNNNLQQLLTSRIRSIFRDNAESVSALDYINQRSTQAKTAARLLQEALVPYGISIETVDIGEVVSDGVLDGLLQTQRDRKIAFEQRETFKTQQETAEQEKQLNRAKQEAIEEKRLATSRYEVQIAEQDKLKRIIAAGAEAEAIRIKAQAQAEAYANIREQIGANNAALMEMLARIGEYGISITPRVMVTGGSGGGGGSNSTDPATVALIGTMLDTMIQQADADEKK